MRSFEPIRRKLGCTIRHVFAAEYAEREHLFWRQLRPEVGVEVLSHGFRQAIDVPVLHEVIDLDVPSSHWRGGLVPDDAADGAARTRFRREWASTDAGRSKVIACSGGRLSASASLGPDDSCGMSFSRRS